MQALGFDYDYTIANYNEEIQPLIYSLTCKRLVDNGGYPKEIAHFEYDPNVRRPDDFRHSGQQPSYSFISPSLPFEDYITIKRTEIYSN